MTLLFESWRTVSDQNPYPPQQPGQPPYGQAQPTAETQPYGQPQPQPYPPQPQYSTQPAYAAQPDPYGRPAASPGGYAAQPDPYGSYAQPAAQRTNTLAIVALVLSLTVPIGGIVTGHIALNQIKRTGEAGHGLALAGMIIGYAYTALVILAIIAYIIFIVVIVGAVGVGSTYSYNT